MTLSDLRTSLALILSLEEDWPIDWSQVQNLSATLASDLSAETPAAVFEYLTGWELRQNDPVFAHSQRSSLAAFIRSSH